MEWASGTEQTTLPRLAANQTDRFRSLQCLANGCATDRKHLPLLFFRREVIIGEKRTVGDLLPKYRTDLVVIGVGPRRSAAHGHPNICKKISSDVHAILFGAGALNSIGNPVLLTIKICGNPKTCVAMKEHIDVTLDDDGIIAQTGLCDGADRIVEHLRRVFCGTSTACEVLGKLEGAIRCIRPSI